MLSNDSVGDDWETSLTCNGSPVQNGDILTVESNQDILFSGKVTETDNIPDIGSGTVCLKHAARATGTAKITVLENRGQYAKNAAVWRLYCSITRVKP